MGALVSPAFFNTTHGKMDCRDCHGGAKFAKTRAEAHVNMDPLRSAKYAGSVCAPCHDKETSTFANSLHAETRGVSSTKKSLVLKRANTAAIDAVNQGLTKNCNTCHVSGCGDCHVSRPQFNDGGFVQGHVFYKSPNSLNNCMGCHGSRIEKEYTGKGESTKATLHADVHWSPNGMQCTSCHKAEWMHGGASYDARYDSPKAPKCADCHAEDVKFKAVPMHAQHGIGSASVYLQCQVCHSQDYNNCTSCHVALDDKKRPFFKTESSTFDFNIGRNYQKSEKKPWDYIVVRHVPVDDGTFDYYGKNALNNMAAAPTWKYATPHTISRITRQTQNGCKSCHGNSDLFLTPDDIKGLSADEVKANAPVVVSEIPQ